MGFLYLCALGMSMQQFSRDKVVLVHDSDMDCVCVVVLRGGCVVVRPAEDDAEVNLYEGDVFCFDESYEEKSHVRCVEDSVVGFVGREVVEGVLQWYPDAIVKMKWNHLEEVL